MRLALNKPLQHDDMRYLIVTPIEYVVMHDPLKAKYQDTPCYRVIVQNGRIEYHELYTEKYLLERFHGLSKPEQLRLQLTF